MTDVEGHTFACDQYPQLRISTAAGAIRFTEGAFTTEDQELAEILRCLPERYGVTETSSRGRAASGGQRVGAGGEGSGPDAGVPPARSAPKGDWVNWAVASGADRDTAESSTKDQLVEQYGAPTGEE